MTSRSTKYEELTFDEAACSTDPNCGRINFLCALFKALDEAEIRYCVLNSWEGLPEELPSDLDMAVRPSDHRKLLDVFRALCAKGYRPAQVFNYLVNAHYFVFIWFEGAVLRSVAVDVISEHRRGGVILASGETLVNGRQRQGLFWIPNPGVEFAYLLAKKTWKGTVSSRQAGRLKHLVGQLGTVEAERLVGTIFRNKWEKRIVAACSDGTIGTLLESIRKEPLRAALTRKPWKVAGYLFTDISRRIHRWFRPTGLFTVVMGPDGVGKSTLVEELIGALRPAFRRHKVFHWRPGFIGKQSSGPVTQPHGQRLRGTVFSIAYLFGFVLDFWLGYILVIRPLLARSGLIIFDRYFEDVLIDPMRYRYGGPRLLAQMLRPLMPKPQLVLVLEAPAEVIFSRKQEITTQELHRQSGLYARYTNRSSKVCCIDATVPAQQVAAASTQVIVAYLVKRFERHHRSWLDGRSTVGGP